VGDRLDAETVRTPGRPTDTEQPESVRPPTLLGISSYLCGNVARAATRRLRGSLRQHDLQLGDHAVLVALDDFGPLAQYEIADRLDVDRSQVLGFVDRLEERRFVTRARDPADRRRVLISITSQGVTAERQVTAAAHGIQAELFAVLSPSERSQLVELLARVLDAYDAARLGRTDA
jgi:DNA-binding MarR family transcriptional regulator